MRSRQFTKQSRQIILILNNIRSVQNVGSILRTADCLGATSVIAAGCTPNLTHRTDGTNLPLLPHVKDKLLHQLHRSALGAETTVAFDYQTNLTDLLAKLEQDGYTIVGLEQSQHSIPLPDYQPPSKIALLLGEEVHGLSKQLLMRCQQLIEIPMFGDKESYNVSVAAGITLYELATR